MITVTFWACLLSSGVCSEKTKLSYAAGPMGCAGVAAQIVARDWVMAHPKYRIEFTHDHPIRCTPGVERSL